MPLELKEGKLDLTKTFELISVFVAFLTFELWLLLAPLLLLLFVLPWMVGARFRTWGLDILRTSWEGRYS
jgi:hypothetical protein